MATQTVRTGYAPVNGLQMYYEIHGSGRPLLMLHGAFMTIEAYGPLLPLLAHDRQVIAVEMQGHGRTADIDRPLSIEQMADDSAALLRHLNLVPVDVFGYSLGSGVALQLAISHPDTVRKLILASGVYQRAGYHPGVLDGLAGITPELFEGSPPLEGYRRLAPNPDDFPNLVKKIVDLSQRRTEGTPEDLRSITAPTMVIIGDSDGTRPEHAVEMFRLFGGGVVGDYVGLPAAQLAILPGTTHVGVMDRVDWLASMVPAFLDAPMPES